MNSDKPQYRSIEEIVNAMPASDGDGVKLRRVFGGGNLARFDPFLMLDEFGSDEPQDYIGGFPSHPHRGFETVTYMLEGKMEHRDHMQNVGLLGPGDVQWMKAGAGVIHSEMPQQEKGRMRGFQLWLNLPAAEKMTPAAYEDITAQRIPVYRFERATIKAIAGNLSVNGQDLRGAVTGKATEPAFLDIEVGDRLAELDILIPDGFQALIYVYEGAIAVGTQQSRVVARQLARLSRNGKLDLQAEPGSRLLVLSGKPLGEPIVQYGPFVMNSREQIEQALSDFQHGRLIS
jgi:redox-sensitive bicupin YhaK (pirin superfamily)